MLKGAMCIGFRQNLKSITYMTPYDENALAFFWTLNIHQYYWLECSDTIGLELNWAEWCQHYSQELLYRWIELISYVMNFTKLLNQTESTLNWFHLNISSEILFQSCFTGELNCVWYHWIIISLCLSKAALKPYVLYITLYK